MLGLLNVREWLIEPNYFSRVYPIALNMINAGKGLKYLMQEGGEDPMSLPEEKAPGVAVIPIQGAITKNGDLCSFGSLAISAFIKEADISKKVSSILLMIDSPGGTVDGTEELGQTIKETNKPIVAFVDNQAASAGYWLASQSDFIILNSLNHTEVGSIGALVIYQNFSKMIEKDIGEVKIIRAPQSVDKARVNPFEGLPKDSETEIKNTLKDITQNFISHVKEGRTDRLTGEAEKEAFTGKMFNRETAIELGLADYISTRQQALDFTHKLGELI